MYQEKGKINPKRCRERPSLKKERKIPRTYPEDPEGRDRGSSRRDRGAEWAPGTPCLAPYPAA